MGRLLTLALCLLVLLGAPVAAQTVLSDDRHQWALDLDLGYAAASSRLGAWPEGALGKLRYGVDADALSATRLLLDYRGRITPTLRASIATDYVDDASAGIGLTEAFLEWRPVPTSALERHWRFGLLYPRFSLENGERGWRSPYTTSFSAVNAWLGEEVRPFGVEWTGQRRLGFYGSPHALGVSVAAFYANDPAGTLLFWRGFSLHDRQTRAGDRFDLPPAPVRRNRVVVGYRAQTLEPFVEIDHAPGYYASVEWRYARRALVQLATWDNRADPSSFGNGQWSWRTKFRHLASQVALPADIGFVAQWMRGETHWIIGASPDGSLMPWSRLVRDDFDARYAMLTRQFGTRHRLSLRHDRFDMQRPEPDPLGIDAGRAWTVAYVHDFGSRLSISAEALRIASTRGLWSEFYAEPQHDTERQFRLQWRLRLGASR